MTDATPIPLLVTSGNGPAECQRAVAQALALLQKEACAMGVTVDISAPPTKHGHKSAVAVLHGPAAETLARQWRGTIQWRVQSTLRPGHKRANWFIGVFDLPKPTTAPTRLRESDVTFETFRAGGAGGQHQNKTDSAVRATHRPTGLTTVARDMRSQHRNKALALRRLDDLLTAQIAADEDAQKSDQNRLHRALERGNPVRRFKGPNFREDGRAR